MKAGPKMHGPASSIEHMAILYGEPFDHTIIALENVISWAMDFEVFKGILDPGCS